MYPVQNIILHNVLQSNCRGSVFFKQEHLTDLNAKLVQGSHLKLWIQLTSNFSLETGWKICL